jgi:hypothetical protein
MVFNLNIVDLTIVITSWNKKYWYQIFFIIPLNYMQFHRVRNLSNKDYIFHGFLSAQQQKLNFLLR